VAGIDAARARPPYTGCDRDAGLAAGIAKKGAMTRISRMSIFLLCSLSVAACGGEPNATGGADNKRAAGAKDSKAAGVVPAGAGHDSIDGCLKSCDASNESATDKATCRLNCDAAFGGNKKNAENDGPR
jgi:hypothetical protein